MMFSNAANRTFAPFDWQPETWYLAQQKYREKIDQTENVCLAYNFRGSAWTRSADWEFVDYDFEADVFNDAKQLEETTNDVRRSVQQLLPAFFEKIKEQRMDLQQRQLFIIF